jgi:3-hydroxybutyryl-CoA dehydrogenase
MGHGIALEFAVHGFNVNVVDRDEPALALARERVDRGLALLAEARSVRRDYLDDFDEVRHRLHYGTDPAAASANADLIIEAVYEDLALKQKLLAQAATTAPQHAIFASNTSSFMPSQLAPSTGRPERFANAHYFNPPYLLPLVEIVPAPGALPEVTETLRTLYEQISSSRKSFPASSPTACRPRSPVRPPRWWKTASPRRRMWTRW